MQYETTIEPNVSERLRTFRYGASLTKDHLDPEPTEDNPNPEPTTTWFRLYDDERTLGFAALVARGEDRAVVCVDLSDSCVQVPVPDPKPGVTPTPPDIVRALAQIGVKLTG